MGGWCSSSVQGPYGVGLWKYIKKGWDKFYPFIIFKVGDNSCIKFCCDLWCEGLPLENNFTKVYNIASNRDASMAELLSSSVANCHWNINFIQPVQDWELESVASFRDLIYILDLGEGMGRIKCVGNSPRGVFNVHSYYRALQPPNSVSFPWKPLWKPKVPT